MANTSTEAFQAVGRTLGRYRLLDGLALGGMAEIYLARVIGSDPTEHVVIKQIQPHLAKDGAFVQLFLNEAELAAQLEHEHIGRVYDQGESDGLYYFAMEYLHGYDARALLDNALRKKQRIPLQHALCIVAKVADALQYAHEKRDPQNKPLHIVHRDVSPSNIFVTYDGQVKLVDFGLARVADDSQKLRPTTIKGKAAYLSPEQCLGQPLDRLSDIFSLGIVLYELTTGTRLFRRQDTDTNYAIMNRIMKGDVPLPASLVEAYPNTLQEVVLQALHVDRTQRHPTARALMLDIEAVARTEGLALSIPELAGYMEQVFGRKSEPWQDLPEEYGEGVYGEELYADEPADESDDESDDEFSQGVSPDEFDEEVATSLYTGNIEDIKDAWAAEALSVGSRASLGNIPTTRASSMRLSLPLTAEDSEEFENPLLTVEEQAMEDAQADPFAEHGAYATNARMSSHHDAGPGFASESSLDASLADGAFPALGDGRAHSQSDFAMTPGDAGGLAPIEQLQSTRRQYGSRFAWIVVLVILMLMAGLVAAAFMLP